MQSTITRMAIPRGFLNHKDSPGVNDGALKITALCILLVSGLTQCSNQARKTTNFAVAF